MNIVLLSHHTETHALTECGDDPVLVNYEKSFIMNEPPGRGTALPLEKDVGKCRGHQSENRYAPT